MPQRLALSCKAGEKCFWWCLVLIASAVHAHQVWPNGRIPYEVDPTLKANTRQLYALLSAKAALESLSCVSFHPRKKEPNYVLFTDLGAKTVCWDLFEKTRGIVPVNVGSNCLPPFSKATDPVFSDCDVQFVNKMYPCSDAPKSNINFDNCDNSSKWRKSFQKLQPALRSGPVRARTEAPVTIRPWATKVSLPSVRSRTLVSGKCGSSCRYAGILTPLFRSFNEEFGVSNHFYTDNKLEQSQMFAKNYMKLRNMGYIGQAATDSMCGCLKPLYRLYNDFYHDTLLTAEEEERSRAESILGYKFERVIGYCTSEPGCGAYLPLYRLFNFFVKDHMYTTEQSEMYYYKNHPSHGYGLERIECYLWQYNVSTQACENR